MEIRYSRILGKGLLIECPMGMELNSCLIRNLRKLPLDERMRTFDDMTDGEVEVIIANHRQCRLRREIKRLNPNT